ncbi:MAG: DUF4397 domain-containing protein [Pseudomonadales bacterium]|nr:DUF4397 domain-containing protein [Pseudomonadales bacterium]
MQNSGSLVGRLIITLTLLVIFTGCSESSSGTDPTAPRIQVINAIVDAPALLLTINTDPDDSDGDNTNTDDTTSYSLAFQDATTTQTSVAGELEFSLTRSRLDGTTVTLIGETRLTLENDHIYILLLSGTYAAPTYELIGTENADLPETDNDEALVRVIHTGNEAQTTVWLSDSESTSSGTAFSILSAGQYSDYQLLADPTESRYLLITDSAGNLVFDGGEVTLQENSRYHILITDDPASETGNSTAIIINSSGFVQILLNQQQNPEIRLLNLIPDANNLNFTFSDSFTGTTLTTNTLGYGEISAFDEVEADIVFLDLSVKDDSGSEIYSTVISLNEDTRYTLIVGGYVMEDTLSSSLSSVTEGTVTSFTYMQFINATTYTITDEDGDEQQIDLNIYLLNPGESLDDASSILNNLASLKAKTVLVEAEPAVLVATDAATGDIIAGPHSVFPESGTRMIVSVVEAVNGGEPLSFLILNDTIF